jgi:rRNA-processing protein FCF1
MREIFMAEVYYYVPAYKSDYSVECGLKLSVWHDKEVFLEGTIKKCISALLNPKDDMKKFKDDSLRCIKMELPSEYCYVADKYLFELGQSKPELMELYYKSIIPIESYIFGLYRLPECLVTTTVISGQIYIVNKAQDTPVLFNNSEELYLNNLLEINKDIYENFEDMILYCFYSRLAELGNILKIEDRTKGIAIFIDNADNIHAVGKEHAKEYAEECLKEHANKHAHVIDKNNNCKKKVYTIKIPYFNNNTGS